MQEEENSEKGGTFYYILLRGKDGVSRKRPITDKSVIRQYISHRKRYPNRQFKVISRGGYDDKTPVSVSCPLIMERKGNRVHYYIMVEGKGTSSGK